MAQQVTDHTHDAHKYGADLSIFMGLGVAGLVYLVLGWRSVRTQAAEQDVILGASGASAGA